MVDGVSFTMRLNHPTGDVGELCESFGLKPRRAWLAGQPRQTPQGGTYPDSYCYCDLPIDQAVYLEDGLKLAVEILKPYAATVHEFLQGGGKVSFSISLEKGVFLGSTINPELLAELASLHITLLIHR